MKLGPIPPAPPDLSGQQLQVLQQGLIQSGLRLNTGQPANPALPASSPVPCPKCRDRGWVFTDILNGATRRCDCGEVF
jgi:hypothetical protein